MKQVTDPAELRRLREEIGEGRELRRAHIPEHAAAVQEFEYVAMLFDSWVILGRFSKLNKDRITHTLNADVFPGPDDEELESWQTGSREQLQATFPDDLPDDVFDQADAAYEKNPRNQIQYARPA